MDDDPSLKQKIIYQSKCFIIIILLFSIISLINPTRNKLLGYQNYNIVPYTLPLLEEINDKNLIYAYVNLNDLVEDVNLHIIKPDSKYRTYVSSNIDVIKKELSKLEMEALKTLDKDNFLLYQELVNDYREYLEKDFKYYDEYKNSLFLKIDTFYIILFIIAYYIIRRWNRKV